jgi:hypothetical protein
MGPTILGNMVVSKENGGCRSHRALPGALRRRPHLRAQLGVAGDGEPDGCPLLRDRVAPRLPLPPPGGHRHFPGNRTASGRRKGVYIPPPPPFGCTKAHHPHLVKTAQHLRAQRKFTLLPLPTISLSPSSQSSNNSP